MLRKRRPCSTFLLVVAGACSGRGDRVPPSKSTPDAGCATEAVEPVGSVDVFSGFLRSLGSRSGGVLSWLDGSNTLGAVDGDAASFLALAKVGMC